MNNLPGLTLSVPLFFHKDQRIDFDSLEKYILGLTGFKHISAIYSMAYNTRYRMLDFDETLEVNKFILKRAYEIGLKCYVGHPYTFNEASLSKYLEEIAQFNPAGISMLYPERYYGMDDPILEFLNFPYKFGLKSVIHEMKLVSGFNGELVDWPEGLIRSALDLPGVVAIKEDSKNDEVTEIVLDECLRKNILCVLAGGGKRRALKFVERGMTTWLNGTTMFFPEAIDKIYIAVMNNDVRLVEFYCNNIEAPFFDRLATKFGWHMAHKAALQHYSFGGRFERFPHATVTSEQYSAMRPTFEELYINVEKFMKM